MAVLLTRPVLDAIVANDISLVFRRWQKPTVKTGGRLRTVVGVLAIDSVEKIDATAITDEQARHAGFVDAAQLIDDLFRERKPTSGRVARADGPRDLYRISVRFDGADDRIDLRANDDLSDEEISTIVAKLDKMDQRSPHGPWTRRVIDLITTWPARRAPELAEMEGRETLVFKADVRKLKALGITESLPVGYQLSPRGIKIRDALISREEGR